MKWINGVEFEGNFNGLILRGRGLLKDKNT